jgi:type IV secretory pathway TrbL component
MTHTEESRKLTRRRLLGGLALLVVAQPAWAVLGVWRRTARRTVVVAGAATAATATAAAGANAAASQQAESAANASAAAAKQAEASASQAAAAAKSSKTPEQQLHELQTLYDQKLITEAEYNAQKQKILDAISR